MNRAAVGVKQTATACLDVRGILIHAYHLVLSRAATGTPVRTPAVCQDATGISLARELLSHAIITILMKDLAAQQTATGLHQPAREH
jgi:hypothetical protein